MSNTMPIEAPQPYLKYQWVVVYKDGSELKQNYLQPDEHHFGHIDQEQLQDFLLEDENGNRFYGVNVPAGIIYCKGLHLHVKFPPSQEAPGQVEYRIIYFRRIRNDYTEGDLSGQVIKHALGVQATIDGKNYKQLLFVGEDDKLELAQVK
jgi:hypothetical protein